MPDTPIRAWFQKLRLSFPSFPAFLPWVLFALAFVVLSAKPLLWLVRSWWAPGYDSPGALVFAVVVGIFLWSASSAPVSPSKSATSAEKTAASTMFLPLALFGLSFLVRLASQLLAINVLGALMLAVDVFALALALRLSDRARPASPLFVAALFCFALPLETLLQRTIGFGLQQISASLACGLLSLGQEQVFCEGVRISVDGIDVLIDLPCSGARLLLLLLTTFFFLGAIKPLKLARSAGLLVATMLLGIVANTLRIALLALGIRYQSVTGIDVMQDPWHAGIGLVISGVSIAMMLLLFRGKSAVPRATSVELEKTQRRSPPITRLEKSAPMAIWSGCLALVFALLVVSLHSRPMDISMPLAPVALPVTLDGFAKVPLPLTAQERSYFSTFGGQASRAGYGNRSLLLVRTTSPLRHLHTPDVCFAGAGQDIRYVGADFLDGPVAVYRSRSSKGDDLRVRVQFISESGHRVHSISEVVWHWFRAPSEAWTMVQTVTPWQSDATEFQAAVRRSLNLNSNLNSDNSSVTLIEENHATQPI